MMRYSFSRGFSRIEPLILHGLLAVIRVQDTSHASNDADVKVQARSEFFRPRERPADINQPGICGPLSDLDKSGMPKRSSPDCER
jgi:hypothetical protein